LCGKKGGRGGKGNPGDVSRKRGKGSLTRESGNGFDPISKKGERKGRIFRRGQKKRKKKRRRRPCYSFRAEREGWEGKRSMFLGAVKKRGRGTKREGTDQRSLLYLIFRKKKEGVGTCFCSAYRKRNTRGAFLTSQSPIQSGEVGGKEGGGKKVT